MNKPATLYKVTKSPTDTSRLSKEPDPHLPKLIMRG